MPVPYPRAKPPNASLFLAGQRIGCQWTSLASALSVLESNSRCGHTKSRCSPLTPWANVAKGQKCPKSLQLAHPYHPCIEFCTFAIFCPLMLTNSFLYWLLLDSLGVLFGSCRFFLELTPSNGQPSPFDGVASNGSMVGIHLLSARPTMVVECYGYVMDCRIFIP